MINLKGLLYCRKVWIDSKELSPTKSQEIVNHSPDGFNWGYGGSGPAQLALAILLELTDKDTALKNYQSFKWDVIAKLEGNFDKNIDIEKYII